MVWGAAGGPALVSMVNWNLSIGGGSLSWQPSEPSPGNFAVGLGWSLLFAQGGERPRWHPRVSQRSWKARAEGQAGPRACPGNSSLNRSGGVKICHTV